MKTFETLYRHSADVNIKIDELYHQILNNKIETTSEEQKKLIEEIKTLVIKEGEYTKNLTKQDVENCLNTLKNVIKENFELTASDDLDTLEGIEIYLKILIDEIEDSDFQYDPNILLRVFDRLKSKKHILEGDVLNLTLTKNNTKLKYEVTIKDIVTSTLNINVAKTLETKIYSLVPTQKSDEDFIEDLKDIFTYFKLQSIFSNFTSEMKALYTNIELSKIPNTDLEKIKNLNIIDDETISDFIFDWAKNLVEELSNIVELLYNPDNIFYFLKIVTAIEVIITYLNKESLKTLLEYSQALTNKHNYPAMSGINNFVKRKIKKS